MSENSNYIQEANKNAEKLESAIKELSNIEINSADQFKQYKESTQKVIEMFKTLKPLLKENRESLWKEFHTISNEIRRKQEKKKEDRINSSKRKKDIVVSIYLSKLDLPLPTIVSSQHLLDNIMQS